MEFKIVRGKFITVDKLDALISANGLSLSVLLEGATNKIREIQETGKALNKEANDHFNKYMECTEKAEELLEQGKAIKSAIDSIKETG